MRSRGAGAAHRRRFVSRSWRVVKGPKASVCDTLKGGSNVPGRFVKYGSHGPLGALIGLPHVRGETGLAAYLMSVSG